MLFISPDNESGPPAPLLLETFRRMMDDGATFSLGAPVFLREG